MVRLAAQQLEVLCPQVINAARVLTARPRSKVALENMDVFKEAWERQVHLLMDAVDDITTIDDFLAVSGLLFIAFSLHANYFLCKNIFARIISNPEVTDNAGYK